MSESTEHASLRQEEILALTSIYDELDLNPTNNSSGTLSIPITLDSPIPLLSTTRQTHLQFLPALRFHFSTDAAYPETRPPNVSLECRWLDGETLRRVEEEVLSLWEGEICLFTMMDEVFERARGVFGLEVVRLEGEEQEQEKVFDEVVKFAEGEDMKRFLEGTYFCEVCLENKKGSECLKLPRCGHVSCKECLADYYGMCITEGLITNVVCVNSTCSTTLKAPSVPKTKADHTLLPFLHPFAHLPSTLELIFPENPDMIARYIRLVKQKFYEKTVTTVYCPRPSCQHPTIPTYEFAQLVVCARCTYPFCKFCRATWHGTEISCKPLNGIVQKYLDSDDEGKRLMTLQYGENVLRKLLESYEQDQNNQFACEKYIRENTMPCPKCGVAIQKIMGCNKMTCVTCDSKFCYLCGEILPKENPYLHYSLEDKRASRRCRGMLFHGIDEEGRLRDAEGRRVEGRGDPNWWRRQNWARNFGEELDGGEEAEEEEDEFGMEMLVGEDD